MKKLLAMLFIAMMLMVSVVPTFALQSPQATTFRFNIVTVPVEGGDSLIDYEVTKDDEGNDVVIIRPNPAPGWAFDHWEIDGAYVAKGDLTDAELELILNGDVTIVPVYKKIGSTEVVTGTPVKPDTSPTSPQTGSNDVLPYAIIMLSVAACGVAAFKLVKSK